MIEFRGSWDNHLPLIELSYNNNYHSSVSMEPFDTVYGKRCRYQVKLFYVGESSILGLKLGGLRLESHLFWVYRSFIMP